MAKGNGGGNKYARRLKNPELIGKGEKQTIQQILDKGPQKTGAEIAKQQVANREKGQ